MASDNLERRVRSYLSNNIQQIQEHGGFFEVQELDGGTGETEIVIGGACSGCGIAPMTMKAIERRLPEEVEGVTDVTVQRAGGPRAAVMPTKTEEMEEMEEYSDYSPPF
jgi:Fe-S cluster biogenesis protein NfuA